MIILDASAAIVMLLGLPHANAVLARTFAADAPVLAPQLLPLEVMQAVRRRVASGLTPPESANRACGLLPDLDMTLVDHAPLLGRVWELRHNLTAYDAAYVALAERFDAPLLTFDAKLAHAPGTTARVELLPK